MTKEDIDYIKSLINSSKSNLSIKEKVNLIKSTQNTELVKECLNNENLDLISYEKVQLIISTGDKEYIKSCVKQGSSLNIGSYDIAYLIKIVGEQEYTKECIKNAHNLQIGSWEIIGLLKEIKDINYIKKHIEDRNETTLTSAVKKELIDFINDDEYTKRCIEKAKEFGLTSEDLVPLIGRLKDSEYVKYCIANREKIGLEKSDRLSLIKYTNDIRYIKSCINNKELGLSKGEIAKLFLDLEQTEELENWIKKTYKNDNIAHITLPPEMTIGIEIESEGDFYVEEQKKFYKNWEQKNDATLNGGVEIVSPILKKGDETEIYEVCELLQIMNQHISETCGGHVHIGANYLKTKEDYIKLLEIWGNTEEIMYIISNKKGQAPRDNVLSYAQTISIKIDEALENGEIKIEEGYGVTQLIRQLKKVQTEREASLNLQNIGKSNQNTLEFRLANGTLNPDIWIQNINLFGSIIVAARELQEIEQTNSQTNNKKYILFEDICTKDMSNDEKLESLLQILFKDEQQRNIYRERYEANKDLFKKANLSLSIPHNKKIKFKTSTIGRNLFVGRNPLTAQELQVAKTVLAKEEYEQDR